MAANDMELKVKIIPEMQDLKTKADTLRESVRAASGFEGDVGAKRAQRLNRVSNDISALLAKTELSSKELKQLNGLFQEFYEILGKAAATTKNVSAAMSELIKKQADALKARNEAAEKRNAILSQGKLKDSGKSFQYLDTTAQKIKDMGGVYTRTSSGELSKKVLTNYNTITSKNINDLYDKSGKPLAQSAAWQEIQDEIKSANGKLANATGDLNKFEKALNEATAAVAAQVKKEQETDNGSTLGAEVSTAQVATSDTLNQLAEDTAKRQGQQSSAELDVQTVQKQSSALGRAFKQFTIYAIAVRAAKKALNEAKKTIQDLDKFLTEQAMVTGKTRQETYALLKEYQNLSKQLGTTTKDVANVATQYMRQGKSTQDALTLTEAAISAAKVAGISATESVNYLTTALNGFRLSAQDAMKVSDKFAAIAATSATSYEEIATALSKVASQANLAGMSIDYTTALLAKGIETTREAPETIGTALKTIIARMRELTDYGETLEGDTDINNVETQLAYVGIALRDNNGELRSTEDVLNDLGVKWDTLNSNQQAAVAKALAGTRQQSRLIAMMSDYERVTELQEIAQRSQGTTLAQMDTYLQGMDASLNKINVAWESIITSLVDSDIIINLLGFIGDTLDKIGEFLSTDFGVVATLTTIAVLTTAIIGTKIREYQISQAQQKLTHQMAKDENLKNRLIQESVVKEKAANVQKLKQRLNELESNRLLAQRLQMNAEANGNFASAARYAAKIAEYDKESQQIKNQELPKAEADLKLEEQKLGILKQQGDMIASQDNLFTKMGFGLTGIVSLLSMIVGLYKTMAIGIGTVIKLTKKEERAKLRAAIADKIKAAWGMAGSASAIPVAGWVIAAGILLAILGVAIGTAVTQNLQYGQSADKAANQINDLSVEILNLGKKSQAIDTAISKFDDLDNQLIKTKKDAEAMTEALNSAADSLSSDKDNNTAGLDLGDMSEQDYYKSLTTNRARKEFLEDVSRRAKEQADTARREQLQIVKNLRNRGGSEWSRFQSDAEYAQARDAIYAIANNNLYNYVDTLKTAGTVSNSAALATESFTQALIENIDNFDQIIQYAEEDNKAFQQLINSIASAEMEIDGVNTKLTEVLESDDFNLKDKVEAFKQMRTELSGSGEALESFTELYSQYEVFEQMGDDVLDFIDKTGITIDEINKLYNGYESLQKVGMNITKEEYQARFQDYLQALARFEGDVERATHEVFDDLLSTADDYTKAWNQLITNFGNIVEVGVLNMGQNIDKLKNQVNSIYETATKWATMSETDRTQFIADNQELFSGTDGARLLKAFESGNYQIIEQALKNNETLNTKLQQQREQLEQELKVELAREGDDRNEAYVRYLQDQLKFFNDEKKLYQASLDLRLEQENKALDQYKDLLQKQHDALTESLEKRKDAYQKYFDEVNQAQEDEDYEEQANNLISNLSKLGSSTDASSMKQSKELEKQLEQLEEDRLKELRERAQEQIISNMETEISEINDKFDKLLENSRELLAQFTDMAVNDPYKLLAQEIAQANATGMTATGLEDFLNTLQTSYGGQMEGVDWSALGVREENNNLILTVNGQEILLGSSDQQAVMEAVYTALKQIGLR